MKNRKKIIVLNEIFTKDDKSLYVYQVVRWVFPIKTCYMREILLFALLSWTVGEDMRLLGGDKGVH